ncbi:hypothetical protein DFH27DRAFT_147560 [Peziza echinospora]|nr:hypothetical protein DFH27DRAFT_147560 [Peziza echinospora]
MIYDDHGAAHIAPSITPTLFGSSPAKSPCCGRPLLPWLSSCATQRSRTAHHPPQRPYHAGLTLRQAAPAPASCAGSHGASPSAASHRTERQVRESSVLIVRANPPPSPLPPPIFCPTSISAHQGQVIFSHTHHISPIVTYTPPTRFCPFCLSPFSVFKAPS